jgi:hypothetical protein
MRDELEEDILQAEVDPITADEREGFQRDEPDGVGELVDDGEFGFTDDEQAMVAEATDTTPVSPEERAMHVRGEP